jgi:hypothetical protein
VETEFRFKLSGISFRVEWKQNSVSSGVETEFVLSGVETEFRFGVTETESFGVLETESFGVSETESFGVLERIVSLSRKRNSISV